MTPKLTWDMLPVFLALPALIFVMAWLLTAQAQSKREWFRSLTIPGTTKSCCDEADCKATRAERRDGQWFAEIDGRMVEIPPGAIVRDQTTYDGAAYVCVFGGAVLCFIPPGAGF